MRRQNPGAPVGIMWAQVLWRHGGGGIRRRQQLVVGALQHSQQRHVDVAKQERLTVGPPPADTTQLSAMQSRHNGQNLRILGGPASVDVAHPKSMFDSSCADCRGVTVTTWVHLLTRMLVMQFGRHAQAAGRPPRAGPAGMAAAAATACSQALSRILQTLSGPETSNISSTTRCRWLEQAGACTSALEQISWRCICQLMQCRQQTGFALQAPTCSDGKSPTPSARLAAGAAAPQTPSEAVGDPLDLPLARRSPRSAACALRSKTDRLFNTCGLVLPPLMQC